MDSTGIYLDHAATTPVDPRVLDAMLPFFSQRFGNPSSVYAAGRDARAALDWSRATIAGLLGCQPRELLMTSGATESNNLALKGAAWWQRLHGDGRGHIVVSAIEHHAVLHAASSLVEHGFELTVVEPNADGVVQPDAMAAALRDDTLLVSVMLANNEIGTLQPVAEIAALAHARGSLVHTDAVQAAAFLPIRVDELGVDLLSMSAHKLYGPKGSGLLYVRAGARLAWQQHGGGQEDTRRGGTENVPGIVGLAVALLLADQERDARVAHCRRLRDRLSDGLLERIADAHLNGHQVERLPNNLNVSFARVDGETLLLSLDMLGVAASSGSACTTGSTEPSHVLLALGMDPELARGSLRLTVGKDTTDQEIDRALVAIIDSVERVRALSDVPA